MMGGYGPTGPSRVYGGATDRDAQGNVYAAGSLNNASSATFQAQQQQQAQQQAAQQNDRNAQVMQARDQFGQNNNPTGDQTKGFMTALYGQEYQPFIGGGAYAANNPIAKTAIEQGVSTAGIKPGETSAWNVPGMQGFYNQMFGGAPRRGTAQGQVYQQSQFANNMEKMMGAYGRQGTGLLNRPLNSFNS